MGMLGYQKWVFPNYFDFNSIKCVAKSSRAMPGTQIAIMTYYSITVVAFKSRWSIIGYVFSPVWLVWNKFLYYIQITTYFCLVEFNPVRFETRAVVVAQLVERSLPIPEVRGSNTGIGKIYWTFVYRQLYWKDENKDKRGRKWPIFRGKKDLIPAVSIDPSKRKWMFSALIVQT